MRDLTSLAAAVTLLKQPGVLGINAVFQPFVVNEGVFVRSENGKFGLRLVRPETGEEAVLDLNALSSLLDELQVARAVLDSAEVYGVWPDLNSTHGFLRVESATLKAWKEQRANE